RYPVKFVALSVFCFPLLAAFAVTWLTQPLPGEGLRARAALGWSAGLWSAAALAIVAFALWRPAPDESTTVTLTNGLERVLFLLLFLGGLMLSSRRLSPAKRAGLSVVLLLVLGLDTLTHVPRQNATIPNRGYGAMPLGLNSIPRVGESRAMISPQMEAFLSHAATPNPLDCYTGARHSLYMDCNLLDGIPCVGGFYPMNLREEAEVRSLFSASTTFPSGLADFLSIAQISSPDKLWEWSARDSYQPWASAGQKAVFAKPAETLAGLAAAGFNPRTTVFLPLEACGLIQATNAVKAQVVASRWSPQQTDLSVHAAEPALVVLAQCFYPAWKAYVDGQPARLWRANHAFEAVEIPAGDHQLELRYEDTGFHVGLVISVVTILGCGVMWWLAWARRQKFGAQG
ncbi:MAG TPA: YfhO family protein, partial [Verrucomicrobiae bacterium]|nr:YfhO family protein [Verrucomicrobiae bacterium]